MQPPSLLELAPVEEEAAMTLGLSDKVTATLLTLTYSSISSFTSNSSPTSSSIAISTTLSTSPIAPVIATSTVINTSIPPTALPTITAFPYSTATMGLTMSKPDATTAASSSGGSTGNPLLMQRPGDCELLGSFALFVQLALGALAMMSLVWKRYRERPQRLVKIWFFDVSKQVFGSALVHVANVFMAMLTSGRFSVKMQPRSIYEVGNLLRRSDDEVYQPNPCSWYLLNLAVDTTLGIPILIILLRLYTCLVSLTPLGKPRESIQSGNYGSPPNAVWWLKQSLIYFCGLFGMKVVVLIIFILFPWISHVSDWALRWTEGNEQLQIVFVMMLFPLIMNAMQYYVIDSFIKKRELADGSADDSESRGRHILVPDSEAAAQRLVHESDSEDDTIESDDEEIRIKDDIDRRSFSSKSSSARSPVKANESEYDPEVDGDAPTVFGSSSSQSQNASLISGK